MLSCLDCKKEHDSDVAPDTGECVFCKGTLSELGENFKEMLNDSIKETFNVHMEKGYLSNKGKVN